MPIELNTTDWSVNYTKCYRIKSLVIVNIYANGTPVAGKAIATGLPINSGSATTALGSSPSIITVSNEGKLVITSAGTGTFIGGCLAYISNS